MPISLRRRKRWLHLPHDHGEPIHRPRYDVVAGVLFAVAGMAWWVNRPMQTHAITFDFPAYQAGYNSFVSPEPTPSVVRITLDESGSIAIDGEPVGEPQLAVWLDQAGAEPSLQVIAFDPHPQTSYLASVRALAIISASELGSELCFSGTHEYRNFSSHPAPMMLTLIAVEEPSADSYRVPNSDLVGLTCPLEAIETVWIN